MDRFIGKRIAIVGLSTEGQDAIKFFLSVRCTLICLDRREKDVLFASYPDLAKLSVVWGLGKDYLSQLDDVDIIVRTPGMALATAQLQKAKREGKELTSVTKLFFELCKAPIIGVTGTKGKGTTTMLIGQMLKRAGKTVYVGGNVGTPLLSQVDKIRKDDWVVLELSSFQLEDLGASPHIAVILSITQDHLANFDPLASNYHSCRDAYVEAKKHCVLFQKSSDIVIVHADNQTSRSFADATVAKQYAYGTSSDADAVIADDTVFLQTEKGKVVIAQLSGMRLLGRHNLENIAAAALAAFCSGVPISVIQQVSATFPGLPHRLEIIGEKNGVLYVNDSFSTTPETTMAAVDAFERPIILICGGSEKGADFTLMGSHIAKTRVKKAIVIGEMTDRLVQALQEGGFQGEIVTGYTRMRDIVACAKQSAMSGDVVLLSPACASFGLFKNYKDRGAQFSYEVSLL